MARTRPPPWAPVAPTTAMIFLSAMAILLLCRVVVAFVAPSSRTLPRLRGIRGVSQACSWRLGLTPLLRTTCSEIPAFPGSSQAWHEKGSRMLLRLRSQLRHSWHSSDWRRENRKLPCWDRGPHRGWRHGIASGQPEQIDASLADTTDARGSAQSVKTAGPGIQTSHGFACAVWGVQRVGGDMFDPLGSDRWTARWASSDRRLAHHGGREELADRRRGVAAVGAEELAEGLRRGGTTRGRTPAGSRTPWRRACGSAPHARHPRR